MKTKGYLLTIAIPTYNRKDLLLRTLNSVLPQIDERVELLISDNASADGTCEMVLSLQEKGYEINYIKNVVNIGPDANFLQCYTKSSGDFVLLLGSDDLLLEGAVSHILSCLKAHPDLSMLYLNHAFFKGEFTGVSSIYGQYRPSSEDVFGLTKQQLMDYVQTQISFMSSFVLRRANVLKIENKEQYIGGYFIHSCIALGATAYEPCSLGIVGSSMVAQDTIYRKGCATGCVIFGSCLKKMMCEVAPKYGYDKKQMNRLYRDFACRAWPRMFARNKKEGIEVNRDFWNNGFKTVKMYPKAWFTVIPAVLIPAFVWKFIFKICGKT